ncbi:MAG: UvrD-helicase domain-containing protein, partial [Acidimicrobiales bacterium]
APGGEAAAEADAAAAAADALDGLDGAAVTTLHGFARRLLAEHPFAAGLPPAFEVLDEVRSAVDLGDRWTGMLDRLLEDPGHARALQWALACGVTLEALRSIAAGLDGAWDRVPEHPPVPVPPAIRRDDVLGPLRAALGLAGECGDPDDGLLVHLRGLAAWADRLEDCGDEVELLGVLAGLGGRVATGRGRQAAWHGRKPEVAGLLALAEEAREQALAAASAYALRALGNALGGMVRQAAAERRREGRLHFHDLLVLARDLVRDHREAQAAVHEQYRYVLVDEVQDTDPLQADLAVRVASPWPAGGGGRWQDLEVGAGRLFYVGDPKQSIYRFRGADDRLFREAAALLVDEPLLLTSNFRSTPGIVAWVDAVFAQLAPADGPAHVPLEAVRPPHGAGPVPPVALIGDHGEPPATAAEARTAEATDVAAVVLAVREDRWPVGDGSRPATLADIAVLVRTRAAVPALEEAFDRAGIPYRLESSSLVYQAPEVRDLLSVLRAVDDPTDQASVVAALRSPGFGCGDDDLLRHRLGGGGWDYRVDGGGDGPVAAGLRALRALHDDRWWLEVSELVARVVEERRLLPLCLDGPRWREAWRRLRFVLDQARQFTEGPAGDLRAFLEWVDVQRGEDARVTEVVLPEGDVDAVRVMTVHAAKGLEFPVVVVAGFGAEPRRAPAGVLFGPGGPELAARRDLATPGYGALDDTERALDDAERVRLLYVAATRARDHLVVSVHRSARAGRTVAARLADACGTCPDLWRPPGVPGPA